MRLVRAGEAGGGGAQRPQLSVMWAVMFPLGSDLSPTGPVAGLSAAPRVPTEGTTTVEMLE